MNTNVGRGCIIAGMQQSGKTHLTQKMSEAKNQNGGFTLVYNPGRDEDWSDSAILQPLYEYELPGIGSKERVRLKDQFLCPKLFLDENTGKYYHAHDIPKIFKGKTVKVYRIGDYFKERRFITSIYVYFYGALVVFDDFKPITKHGLKGELSELFSRQNHTGKNYCGNSAPGIDIAWIYHNLDGPPTELYDYASHIIMFNTAFPPKKDTGNDALNDARFYCYEKLLSLPRFSYATIKIRDVQKPQINFYIHK